MTRNGIKVHVTEDSEEAIKLVKTELGGIRLIVKSKSNLTKEVRLVGILEESGILVIEIDF